MRRRFSHPFPATARLGLSLLLAAAPQLANAQFAGFAESQPQAAVAGVLDAICGVSATGDLQTQCDDFGGVLGNGAEGFTLQQFAHEEYAAGGNLAVELSSRQRQAVGERLRELEEGEEAQSDARATFSLAGFGGFLAATTAWGEHDGSSREDPFDVFSAGFVAGVDRWIGERAVLGAVFLYENRDLDFDSVGRVSDGEIEVNAYGGSLYGSFDAEVVELDAVVSFTYSDLDQERRLVSQTPGYPLSRTARSDTDSQTYGAALTASRRWSWQGLSLVPFGELSYQAVNVDAFSERGSGGLDLRVEAQDVHSLQSTLGLRAAYAISTGLGVLLPQLRVGWRHEYLDDDRDIDARFLADSAGVDVSPETDDPDRDYLTLGAGLSLTLPRGFQPYVDYETVLGLSDVENHVIRAGLRLEI